MSRHPRSPRLRFGVAAIDKYAASWAHSWSMDEASGTRYNRIKTGYNLSNGALTVGQADGILGKSSLWSGSNLYLRTGLGTGWFGGRTKATAAAWFYCTNYASGYRCIISEAYGSSPASIFILQVTTSGYIQFVTRNNVPTTFNLIGTSAISLDTWYFVVGVVDFANGFQKTYLNGTEYASTAVTGTSIYAPTPNGLCVGTVTNDSGATSNVMAGRVDETDCWSDALDTTAISALYNDGKGRIPRLI